MAINTNENKNEKGMNVMKNNIANELYKSIKMEDVDNVLNTSHSYEGDVAVLSDEAKADKAKAVIMAVNSYIDETNTMTTVINGLGNKAVNILGLNIKGLFNAKNATIHGATFADILQKKVSKEALTRIIEIDTEELLKATRTFLKKAERLEKEEDYDKVQVITASLVKSANNIAWHQKQIANTYKVMPFALDTVKCETKKVREFVNSAVWNLHEHKGVNIRTSSQTQKIFGATKSNPFAGHQMPGLVVNRFEIDHNGNDNRENVFVGMAQNVAAQNMSQYIQRYIHPEYLPGGLFSDRAFLNAAMLYVNDIDAGQLVMSLVKTNEVADDGTEIYKVRINDLMLVRANIDGIEKLVWAVKSPNNPDDKMILLESHEEVDKMSLLYKEDGTKRDAWLYTGQWGMSSAGAMKQNGLFLTGVYVGEDQSQVINWRNIIDRMTCGGWSLLCKKNIKYMTPQAIAQQSMRWAQTLAPSSLWTDVAPIPTFMNIPGKFKYIDPATGKKKDLIDGMYVVLATYIWHVFNSIPKIKETYYVNPEAATGLLMQCRPWSVLKGTAMSITEEMMAAFIRQLLPLFENGIVEIHVRDHHVVSVNGKAPASEDQVVFAYYNYACSKGVEGEYGGKAVLIVYDNILDTYKGTWPEIEILGKKYPMPALIADFNGQKTGFDLRYESGLRILNYAHNDTSQGNTSVQTINGMLRENPTEGYKFLEEQGKKFIDEKFAALENHTPKALGLKALIDGIDYRSVLGIVAPDIELKYYAPGLRTNVNAILEGVCNRIGECKIGIKNVTLMLTVDPFVWLTGHNVLTVKNGIVDIWATTVAEGQRGIFNRFPKIMWNEMLKTVNGHISDIEIKALLQGINTEDVTMTISLMKSFCKGIVALPGMAFVAALIGGADFDGDKGKLNMEEVETNIMWNVTSCLINKGDGAKDYDGKKAEDLTLQKLEELKEDLAVIQ